jgi:hypothetical protein
MPMRTRSRVLAVLVVGAACLVVARAWAAGSIVTIGAAIDSGAGTPKGRVIVNPSAPLAPAPLFDQRELPPALGSMTGSIAEFAGPSSADTEFSAASNVSLAAGTHTFTSFTVASGATVTCEGAVTIEVVGNAIIAGSVVSSASGASIALVVGGDLTIDGSAEIATTGSAAPVSLDVAGRFSSDVGATERGTIRAASGDVVLVQHGTAAALVVDRTDVTADTGRVDIRSAGAAQILRSFVTSGGDMELRTYGAGLSVQQAQLAAGGALRCEAATRFDLTSGTVQSGAALDVAAFGGRIEGFIDVSFATASGAVGDLVLRASDHVMFYGWTDIRHRGTGTLRLESINADVKLGSAGATTRTSQVVHEGTGDVLLREGSMVTTYGPTTISAAHGDVQLHGLYLEFNGDADLAAPEGLVDLRSKIGLRFRVDAFNTASGKPTVTGETIRVSSQSNTLADVEFVQAGAGGLRVAATQLTLRGVFRSDGPVFAATTAGLFDLAGAYVRTTNILGQASAPVRIEQFAGDGAAIDATNATIRSGDATGHASGDVSVLVRVPGGADLPDPTPDPDPDPDPDPAPQPYIVDGLVVVQSAHAVVAADGGPARLDVRGFLDTGAVAVSLAGTMQITVGDDVRTVDLAGGSRGRLRFRNPSLAVELKPSAQRSSRVPFRLQWTGDTSAFLDAEGTGQFDLKFESAALDAETALRLDGGRFHIGEAPDDLFEPRLALLSAQVTPLAGPQDRVALTVQFATIGASLETPPDVAVSIGDQFSAQVPASAFAPARRGRFIARSPVEGVDRVEFDPVHGRLRIWAEGIEFGTFPADDPVQVDLALSFGDDDVRYQRLRLGRRGSRLVY